MISSPGPYVCIGSRLSDKLIALSGFLLYTSLQIETPAEIDPPGFACCLHLYQP